MVRLEWLGQLKNRITSSGIEPATFRLVAQCPIQLRYRVPPRLSLIALQFDVIQSEAENHKQIQPRNMDSVPSKLLASG
jgi:hypothetical protein